MLEEIALVRQELGYPISATPFSQLVGMQAVLNIITGERYAQTTDEVVMYVLGAYGEPPAPIDAEVMDRVLSTPRGRALAGWERPDKTLEEVREEYGGRGLSDDELFRRHFAPVEDIEAARAAGPVLRDYPLFRLALGSDQAGARPLSGTPPESPDLRAVAGLAPVIATRPSELLAAWRPTSGRGRPATDP